MKYVLEKVGNIYRGAGIDEETGNKAFGSEVISFDGEKLYHLFTTEIDELTDEQIKIAVKSDPSLKYALFEF